MATKRRLLSFIVQFCLAGAFPSLAAYDVNTSSKPLMRAWACSGKSHQEMINNLVSANIIKSTINKDALLAVDRRNYVPDIKYAYDDSPQPIGYGATISAPHMHAFTLEELLPSLLLSDYPTRPLKILDVGCGSGYLTAVFGRMIQQSRNKAGTPRKTSLLQLPSSLLPSSDDSSLLNDGKVYGIDVIPQLVQLSTTNIMKQDKDLFDSNTVKLIVRDGWNGYPEASPYNVIHVGAAASSFPLELMKQLALGGRMVIPVGPESGPQILYQVERVSDEGQVVGLDGSDDATRGFVEDDYDFRQVLGVRYVPLVRSE